MLERPLILSEPMDVVVDQPTICPSWCDEGDRHFEDGYHFGDGPTAIVGSTMKDAPKLELRIVIGQLPGQEPNILVSSDGFDGFEGSPDEIESLGQMLLDAADSVRDDGPAATYSPISEPEHVARLSEGQEAAEEVAERLTELLGHLVETCTGEAPLDVAVLLYPADVRRLLSMAGVAL